MNIESMHIIGIISIFLFLFSFYFTLSFIESLFKGDVRITRQSKLMAIVCLILSLSIPVLYALFQYYK